MMDTLLPLPTLIDIIRQRSDCRVYPARGLPQIGLGHQLPPELMLFYHLCGGLDLFQDAVFPTHIVPPEECVPANPIIFAGVSQADLDATRGDPSWSWYLFATGPNSQYITVDMHPERLGRYYNSFWALHPDNSEIIAQSASEVLTRLLETEGLHYWFDV